MVRCDHSDEHPLERMPRTLLIAEIKLRDSRHSCAGQPTVLIETVRHQSKEFLRRSKSGARGRPRSIVEHKQEPFPAQVIGHVSGRNDAGRELNSHGPGKDGCNQGSSGASSVSQTRR